MSSRAPSDSRIKDHRITDILPRQTQTPLNLPTLSWQHRNLTLQLRKREGKITKAEGCRHPMIKFRIWFQCRPFSSCTEQQDARDVLNPFWRLRKKGFQFRRWEQVGSGHVCSQQQIFTSWAIFPPSLRSKCVIWKGTGWNKHLAAPAAPLSPLQAPQWDPPALSPALQGSALSPACSRGSKGLMQAYTEPAESIPQKYHPEPWRNSHPGKLCVQATDKSSGFGFSSSRALRSPWKPRAWKTWKSWKSWKTWTAAWGNTWTAV